MHHGGYARILTALDTYVTNVYGMKYRIQALKNITALLDGMKDTIAKLMSRSGYDDGINWRRRTGSR